MRLRAVPLRDFLGELAARLAPRADRAGMRLSVDAPPAEVAALADPVAVDQILFNLVDNACKYARGGAEPTITLSAARENGGVVLRVRDRGPGVPAARRLARAMGGDLVLESSTAEGACFALQLRTAGNGT